MGGRMVAKDALHLVIIAQHAGALISCGQYLAQFVGYVFHGETIGEQLGNDLAIAYEVNE